MPVYQVVQFGISSNQANMLAGALNIPPAQMTLSNGYAFYMNPSNYLAVPTLPVTNAAILDLLRNQTVNENPAIPLQYQQIDFGTLSNLMAFDSGLAMQITTNALMIAGATPQYGTPIIRHASFTAFYSNADNTTASNTVPLDTEVSYQFTLPGGYPLEGSGAQVQANFGPGGNVTRFLYAAPQMASTTTVVPIAMSDALNQASNSMDPMHVFGQLNLSGSWVYRLPFCRPCVAGPIFVPPWIKVVGSTLITNPVSGEVSSMDLIPQYVPGTTDSRFVPRVTLTAATVGNTQVVASAEVTGGMPPYRYSWTGSLPQASANSSPSNSYVPIIRATPPPLQMQLLAASHQLLLHWWAPDPGPWLGQTNPQPWVLESRPDLSLGNSGWIAITNPGWTTLNGVTTAVIDLGQPRQFFRLRLAVSAAPTMENVGVTVADANGVSVQARLAIPVLALVQGIKPLGNGHIQGVPDWGTESPYDPGIGTGDRNDWRAGMFTYSAGPENFLWTGVGAWKEDFIDAPVGINDVEVDNANITLYIGHGNPTCITFTGGPGPISTYIFYNNSSLANSWGNKYGNWLGLLSCEVLQEDWNGIKATSRWGREFDGLHTLLGFSSLAWPGTGFPYEFARGMLGNPVPPFPGMYYGQAPVVSAWFSAAHGGGTGTPAALGPIGPGNASDLGEYYWDRGPVGPTIRAWQITGWWYLSY